MFLHFYAFFRILVIYFSSYWCFITYCATPHLTQLSLSEPTPPPTWVSEMISERSLTRISVFLLNLRQCRCGGYTVAYYLYLYLLPVLCRGNNDAARTLNDLTFVKSNIYGIQANIHFCNTSKNWSLSLLCIMCDIAQRKIFLLLSTVPQMILPHYFNNGREYDKSTKILLYYCNI